jgi:dynein heavy chain
MLPWELQLLTLCGSVQIQTQIIDQARAEQVPESSDSLFAYLIERVRNNLHIVLCLSPVGDPFR